MNGLGPLVVLGCLLLALSIRGAQGGTSSRAHEASKMPFVKAEGNFGLDGETGFLAALADMNGDRSIDLVYVGPELKSIYFYEMKGRTYNKMNMDLEITASNISNVISGDFNGDGKADILVMTTNEDATGIKLIVNESMQLKESDVEFTPSDLAQPMVVYLSNKDTPSLLGISGITHYISKWDTTTGKTETASDLFPDMSCKFTHPHSNAYIDFDGDCISDFAFTCEDGHNKRLQIWTSEGDRREKKFDISIPLYSGPLSYADMNMDGTTDIVFLTCPQAKDCTVNIIYNKQLPLCTISATSNCRSQSDLCSVDKNFHLSANPSDWGQIKLKDYLLSNESPLYYHNEIPSTIIPIPPKLVDLNNNGFKDIVITTNKGLIALESTVKSGTLSPDEILNEYSVKRITDESESLNIVNVSFLDVDGDGLLDAIYTTKEKSTFKTTILLNRYLHPGYFYRAYVHQGKCPDECTLYRIPPIVDDSSINFGSTMRFVSYMVLLQGSLSSDSLIPQTSYFSLNLPYLYLGLDRKNNYIQHFTLAVANFKDRDLRDKSYEFLVHNTELRLSPYDGNTSIWKLESYPHIAMPLYVYLIYYCSSLFSIGAFVLILMYNSKMRDKRERLEYMNNIDFSVA